LERFLAETFRNDSTDYQIFISYARPDEEFAASLYNGLRAYGFQMWMDTKAIKPGQNWDFEIRIALERSSFIIILLSNRSVDRRGYVQREIKIALEKFKEKLIDDIFIIPVIIDDDVVVPAELRSIQYISIKNPRYEVDIVDAINLQIERLGGERKRVQEEKDVYWSFRDKKEVWDGLPGYEYEVRFPLLSSDTYPQVNEISEFIRGEFLRSLFRLRENKISQSTESHSFANSQWSRMDTFHATCGDPVIKNRVISIKYLVDWYGAGAAHPNRNFNTFCFILDPLIHIWELSKIFEDEQRSLEFLKEASISELLQKRLDDGTQALEEEWVRRGIEDWDSFQSFVFRENGIEILFPPYQVGSYADGAFEIEIPYRSLLQFIAREYKIALGVQYMS
jgi:hypothetical protein